jgi:hypothetical protein
MNYCKQCKLGFIGKALLDTNNNLFCSVECQRQFYEIKKIKEINKGISDKKAIELMKEMLRNDNRN